MRLRGSKGQTLVLVALMLVAMLGMAALALDGSNLYLQRRQMQTAADAGALAAARARCAAATVEDQSFIGIGNQLCQANRTGTYPITCTTVGVPERSARVTATTQVEAWFARVLGMNTFSVGATAVGNCSGLRAARNLLPVAVRLGSGFVVGQEYTLYDEEKENTGSFGLLRWDEYLCDINNCNLKCRVNGPECSPWVEIGDWVHSEQGAELGSITTGNSGDPLVTRYLCEPNTVTVPIYEEMRKSGVPEYLVIGFGEFVLTGVCTAQNQNKHWTCPGYPGYDSGWRCGSGEQRLRGHFVGWVTDTGIPGGEDYGLRMIYLSE